MKSVALTTFHAFALHAVDMNLGNNENPRTIVIRRYDEVELGWGRVVASTCD